MKSITYLKSLLAKFILKTVKENMSEIIDADADANGPLTARIEIVQQSRPPLYEYRRESDCSSRFEH